MANSVDPQQTVPLAVLFGSDLSVLILVFNGKTTGVVGNSADSNQAAPLLAV